MAMTYDREGYVDVMVSVFNDEIRKVFNDPTLDTLAVSLQQYLFQSIGEALAQATSYAEYLARETKWDLAVNPSSIMSEIAFRGYIPKKPLGARGSVLVSVSSEDGTTNPYGVEFSEAVPWSAMQLYDAGAKVIYNVAPEEEQPEYNLYTASTAILTYSLPPNTLGSSYWELESPPTHEPIALSKWFQFTTSDGITYSTYQDSVIPSDAGYTSVPVIQGIPTTYSYTAKGTDFESINVLDANFEESYYEVYVDGTPYIRIDSIYNASANEKVYEIRATTDKNQIQFRFGNNFFGSRLNSQSKVDIYYLQTAGIEGNVVTRHSVQSVVEPIQPDNGGNNFLLSVTNMDNITGGAHGDSLEDIKEFAVSSFQTQQRCVTYDDYKRLLLSHQLIEKVLIWGAYEYLRDNSLDLEYFIPETENRIFVTAITPDGRNLTTSEKENILLYLLPYKSPTDLIKFEDAHLISVVFNVNAYVQDRTLPLDSVKGAIENHLTNTYSVAVMDFNQAIYETVWKGAIHTAVPSIVYHESFIELEEKFDFHDKVGESYMAQFIELGFDNIEDKDTFENVTTSVWFKATSDSAWVKIGQASSSGTTNLEGIGEYTTLFTAGQNTINYTTGEVLITLDNGEVTTIFGIPDEFLESCEIKIRYRLENEFDVIPSERSQLLAVSSTSVTVRYI